MLAAIPIHRNVTVGPAGAASIFAEPFDATNEDIIRRLIQVIAVIIGRATSRRTGALIGIGTGIRNTHAIRHAGHSDILMTADAILATPVIRTDIIIGTLIEIPVRTGMHGGRRGNRFNNDGGRGCTGRGAGG